MNFDISAFARKNILDMRPYSSARDEFQGKANICLDANESPYDESSELQLNRYPDPRQKSLKEKISAIKGIPADNIFLGNGSDEAIDLLYRIFCEPGKNNVIIMPPTYGMYEVCAEMNDVNVRKVNLLPGFTIDLDSLQNAIDEETKMIFICSPNNPTGNSIPRQELEIILNNFDGLVIIDEAYINYSRQRSLAYELEEYGNLVVLQTLSKAWGLAAVRVGMAFASNAIISLMNKVKYPYNISKVSQDIAIEKLDDVEGTNSHIREIVEEREKLIRTFGGMPIVEKVYPSDANFLLIKFENARKVYDHLAKKGIIVRDRSREPLCEQCLRITIGTPAQNQKLLEALKDLS